MNLELKSIKEELQKIKRENTRLKRENTRLKKEVRIIREEHGGIKNKSSYIRSLMRIKFKEFTDDNLPCRTNFFATDLDLVTRTSKNCFAIYEIKSNEAKVTEGAQLNTLKAIDACFKKLCNENLLSAAFDELEKNQSIHNYGCPQKYPDETEGYCKINLAIDGVNRTYYYLGLHTIEFGSDEWGSGSIVYDGEDVTKEELIGILNFSEYCEVCYKKPSDIDPCPSCNNRKSN